jgi:membrane glycosyltransferase
MEVTCTRCHQAILAVNCYCPVCGLPQLVYPVEATSGQTQQQRWDGAERDAGSIDWKPALRAAMLLAIPAGLLSSGVSPLVALGLLWMTAAGVWAVVLYMRSQRPAWITIGAGARIGLVTGLLAGWLAFGVSSSALFVQRFLLHQSSQIDAEWKARVVVAQQMAEQLTSGMTPADAAQAQAVRAQFQAWMLSPEGHAGMEVFQFAVNFAFLLFFAVAGGALGARLVGRRRQPEV